MDPFRPSLQLIRLVLVLAVFVSATSAHGSQPSGGQGAPTTSSSTSHTAPVPPAKLPTIEEKTASMKRIDGFFPLYWDDTAGTLWLEISRFDTKVLYVTGVATGIGSNDIGVDRGQVGGEDVVIFRRVGRSGSATTTTTARSDASR